MLWQKEPLAKHLFEFSISHGLLWRCTCHAIACVALIEFLVLAGVSHRNKQTQTLVAERVKTLLYSHYKLAGILFHLITDLS